MSSAITKLLFTVLTDEKVRKKILWTIGLILSPFILLIIIMFSLLTGFSNHNNKAVDLCFNGGIVGNKVPKEYKEYIFDMRHSFDLLDNEIANISADIEEGSLDTKQIKALFYSLYFGADSPSRKDHKRFVRAFVRYEERTRIITVIDTDGKEIEVEESYTIAIPIQNPETIYSNLENSINVSISEEQKKNAHEIYSRV